MPGSYVFGVMYTGNNPGARLKAIVRTLVDTRMGPFSGLVTLADGNETTDKICSNYADLGMVQELITDPTFALLVVRGSRSASPVERPLLSLEIVSVPLKQRRDSADLLLEASALIVKPSHRSLFQGWLPGHQAVVVTSRETDLGFFPVEHTIRLTPGKEIYFRKKIATITTVSPDDEELQGRHKIESVGPFSR